MSTAKLILAIDNIDRPYSRQVPQGWDPLNNFNRGSTSTESYNNYSQDVVLSGLQKSLNRGFNLEAVRWGLEQFYTNKFVRNWTWNVLLEYSLDAIGPADPTAFLRVNYLRNNFYDRPEAYITAILLLCQARKTNIVLFANLLYPELKVKGVADKVPSDLTLDALQQDLELSIYNKDLQRGLYVLYFLAYSEKTLRYQIQGSSSPIAMIFESFSRFYPLDQNTYPATLLKAALQDQWRWEHRSIKIYLLLLHLHCTNSIPTTSVIQQFPADNVGYLAEMFKARDPIISWFGPTPYQMDLSTGWGRQNKATKDEWIANMSVLDNESIDWRELSKFYAHQVSLKKSKKLYHK